MGRDVCPMEKARGGTEAVMREHLRRREQELREAIEQAMQELAHAEQQRKGLTRRILRMQGALEEVLVLLQTKTLSMGDGADG